MALAVWLGRFIGAVLAECGPMIVEVIRACFTNTAQDSKPPADLRARLLARLDELRNSDKDNLYPPGRPGATPGTPKES